MRHFLRLEVTRGCSRSLEVVRGRGQIWHPDTRGCHLSIIYGGLRSLEEVFLPSISISDYCGGVKSWTSHTYIYRNFIMKAKIAKILNCAILLFFLSNINRLDIVIYTPARWRASTTLLHTILHSIVVSVSRAAKYIRVAGLHRIACHHDSSSPDGISGVRPYPTLPYLLWHWTFSTDDVACRIGLDKKRVNFTCVFGSFVQFCVY